MYVGISPACMSVHQVPAWCPQRAEDSMRSPIRECFLDPGDVCPPGHDDVSLGAMSQDRYIYIRNPCFQGTDSFFKAYIQWLLVFLLISDRLKKRPPWGVPLFVGVGLLEYVWPCRRKCITMEGGFEVSYVLKPCLVRQITSCFLQESQLLHQLLECLQTVAFDEKMSTRKWNSAKSSV